MRQVLAEGRAFVQVDQRIDLFTMSRKGLGAPRVSHETAPPRGPPARMAQILSPPTLAGVLPRHDMMPDRTGWTVYDALESRPVRLALQLRSGRSRNFRAVLVCREAGLRP